MSNHQNKILQDSDLFTLIQRKKNDRKWYEVRCELWRFNEYAIANEVRDFFDPLRNKSGNYGSRWKYKNRKEAEQKYLMAIIRWGN